jgi:hypothetical protein
MQACRCPEWRLRILEHELSARTEGFGEWRLARVRAGELFFEALTGGVDVSLTSGDGKIGVDAKQEYFWLSTKAPC